MGTRTSPDQDRLNRVAQWAFDARPVLSRFHLWLEDVTVEPLRGDLRQGFGFFDRGLDRALVMATGVTALGTYLFGCYGEGKGKDKSGLNAVKKNADAMSSYALSEGLWHLSRNLPENHAIMVCLGEGLMPKAGETPEMGANPLLGFGRVYARPQVARFLDKRVARLINDPSYGWEGFSQEVQEAGITIWGAAVDTLENTSRFALGAPTGPLTVLHLFDQPLILTRPYEGYMGNLFLPQEVVDRAAEHSVLLDFHTPRRLVLEMLQKTYPDLRPENVHVWTLGGKSRETRLGRLWAEWRELGVHLIEDGWPLPTGMEAFTESGTYAPTYQVGSWVDDRGVRHVFLADGYAASAEAVQAATLAPLFGLHASLVMFSSKFKLPHDRERHVMRLDPEAPDFADRLQALFDQPLAEKDVAALRENIREARLANLPLEKRTLQAEDLFPHKQWNCLALAGFMLPDPYSGFPGVTQVGERTYRVTVRATSRSADARVDLTLRLLEEMEESWRVFNPLLDRFVAGEDYRRRPVKISDSGRIRNELQTLCSQALEFFGEDGIRVHFDRIHDDLMSPEKREKIREILAWYKENHPVWFRWLELA